MCIQICAYKYEYMNMCITLNTQYLINTYKHIVTQMANLQDILKMNQDQIQQVKSNDTNQIIYDDSAGSNFLYYVPAYMQLTFNSISEVDYKNLKSQVHCDITFTINVEHFPQFIVDHLRQNIVFLFSNDESMKLEQGNDEIEVYKEEDKQYDNGKLLYHYIQFQVRKVFVTGMVPYVKWTPFELLDLILTISPRVLANIKFKDYCDEHPQEISSWPTQLSSAYKDNKKSIKIQFNLMNQRSKVETINFGVTRKFGIYSVAISRLFAEFTNQAVPFNIRQKAAVINKIREDDKKQNNLKVKCFETAHFHIVVYKNPTSAAVTILVPVLMLSVINLGIFFQDYQLAGRLENIAGLMFAFVAILPVIRDQIPPNPNITYVEMLVYLLTLTNLLCLITSVEHRKQANYVSTVSNPFFIASLFITCATAVIILTMLALHQLVWKKEYDRSDHESRQKKFNHVLWRNPECDQYFIQFFDHGPVKPVSQLKVDEENQENEEGN